MKPKGLKAEEKRELMGIALSWGHAQSEEKRLSKVLSDMDKRYVVFTEEDDKAYNKAFKALMKAEKKVDTLYLKLSKAAMKAAKD